MIPAMKFLKHKPRGLKNIKGEGVEKIEKIEKIVEKIEQAEAKKITPLQFKKR